MKPGFFLEGRGEDLKKFQKPQKTHLENVSKNKFDKFEQNWSKGSVLKFEGKWFKSSKNLRIYLGGEGGKISKKKTENSTWRMLQRRSMPIFIKIGAWEECQFSGEQNR